MSVRVPVLPGSRLGPTVGGIADAIAWK